MSAGKIPHKQARIRFAVDRGWAYSRVSTQTSLACNTTKAQGLAYRAVKSRDALCFLFPKVLRISTRVSLSKAGRAVTMLVHVCVCSFWPQDSNTWKRLRGEHPELPKDMQASLSEEQAAAVSELAPRRPRGGPGAVIFRLYSQSHSSADVRARPKHFNRQTANRMTYIGICNILGEQ